MHILQIASGDFFSTYGGGQVYVKNLVDEMIQQSIFDMSVISFGANNGINERWYKRCKLYEVGSLSDSALSDLIRQINPDLIHAHSHKGQVCRVGKQLGKPVIVTSHHGGIVCPAGTLLNCKDEICQVSVCHKNCLKCCLRNIKTGLWWYPFMRLVPETLYYRLGNWLQHLPFIYFVTPILSASLYIKDKQQEWQDIVDNCTVMIAPCFAMKEAMVRNAFDERRIEVIPHGIPLPKEKPIFPSTKNGIRFFYVGRICYVKGVHIMLEAFHKLKAPKAELHIIGGAANKTERKYEKSLKKKYRLDGRIVWHEKVAPKAVYDAIKGFHISISSSIFLEAFGLNIAESLAMGKPVLATRSGGAEMQIQDGINGWLIPTKDVDAMMCKMKEIISTPELVLVNMVSQNYVFTIEEHCKTLSNIYINEAHTH